MAARGAYFKTKYGGGARGWGSGGGRGRAHADRAPSPVMQARPGVQLGTSSQLEQILRRIDNKPYGAYKDLMGRYLFPEVAEHPSFILSAEHIQADAYAPPSRFRALVSMSRTEFPEETYSTRTRKIALCDYITRHAHALIKKGHWDRVSGGKGWSGSKGGDFTINAPSQQVLERNSCLISQDDKGQKMMELRFTVGLPAAGRTILGEQAAQILTVKLPQLVKETMLWKNLDEAHLMAHIKSVEDQEVLRDNLESMGLIAFVGNGSVLPRASGVSALPMTGPGVVPFKSPPSLEVTIETPNRGLVTGMGIPKGITVLSGGGFHGKSTLLEAIELGIYNYVLGDGRETVVTNDAVKIRAEDGRAVVATDITPFIGVLPGGKLTDEFTSEDASGSTSMAANIQEALELGAKTLLLDEDSCATNLLIRDQRMQALIQAEPITPLVAKAQALYEDHGVSTMLVIGGCGDYLSIANMVIGMEDYLPFDLTQKAQTIASAYPVDVSAHTTYGTIPNRIPHLPPFHTAQKGPIGRDTRAISTSITPDIEIGEIEQFVEAGQVRTCAEALRYIARGIERGISVGGVNKKKLTMGEWRAVLEEVIEKQGIDALNTQGWVTGDMVSVRGMEIMAVVNRVRGLKAKKA
ncbi:hypothetical protein EV426DRAFT_609162 [Tirmania nivea]|nr:hypothetical protein EV426DRAFT_609162 [Tirmania nivea]